MHSGFTVQTVELNRAKVQPHDEYHHEQFCLEAATIFEPEGSWVAL